MSLKPPIIRPSQLCNYYLTSFNFIDIMAEVLCNSLNLLAELILIEKQQP